MHHGVGPELPDEPARHRSGITQHGRCDAPPISSAGQDNRLEHVAAGLLAEPHLFAVATVTAALHQRHDALVFRCHEGGPGLATDVEFLLLAITAGLEPADLHGLEIETTQAVLLVAAQQVQQPVRILRSGADGVARGMLEPAAHRQG